MFIKTIKTTYEEIKIKKLKKKKLPLSNDGYFFMAKIMDEQNRIMYATDRWTKDKWIREWKVGDTISAFVLRQVYMDREGYIQVGYSLERPKKDSWLIFYPQKTNYYSP